MQSVHIGFLLYCCSASAPVMRRRLRRQTDRVPGWRRSYCSRSVSITGSSARGPPEFQRTGEPSRTDISRSGPRRRARLHQAGKMMRLDLPLIYHLSGPAACSASITCRIRSITAAMISRQVVEVLFLQEPRAFAARRSVCVVRLYLPVIRPVRRAFLERAGMINFFNEHRHRRSWRVAGSGLPRFGDLIR